LFGYLGGGGGGPVLLGGGGGAPLFVTELLPKEMLPPSSLPPHVRGIGRSIRNVHLPSSSVVDRCSCLAIIGGGGGGLLNVDILGAGGGGALLEGGAGANFRTLCGDGTSGDSLSLEGTGGGAGFLMDGLGGGGGVPVTLFPKDEIPPPYADPPNEVFRGIFGETGLRGGVGPYFLTSGGDVGAGGGGVGRDWV